MPGEDGFDASFGVIENDSGGEGDDASEAGDDDGHAEDGGDDGLAFEPFPPSDDDTRYPAGRVHSPVTRSVARRMLAIAERDPSRREDVFLKAGASSTVSRSTLYCFAGEGVELGEHVELQPALAYFLGGMAGDTTPFDRVTLAAEVGRSAGWVTNGDPSPLRQEIDVLSPRLGLVHFGTNDMGAGSSYASALVPFHENMMTALELLADEGVVPIVFGITRRGDSAGAQRWVNTYNAVIRGMAQALQVPHVDLFTAIDPLPGHGLGSDGLHLEAYGEGACVLDEAGLGHGYNLRNLVALEALDRAMAVLVDDAVALDRDETPPVGVGTRDEPIEIDAHALPWADYRDVRGGESVLDVYSACSDTDESGPEVIYRLVLERETRVRALVLDRVGVDVDLHLLDASAEAEGCLARSDRLLDGTLAPGTYHFAIDTWVSDGVEYAGEYLFVVLECDDDDPDCDAAS